MIAALALASALSVQGPLLNIPPFAPFNDRAATNASAHVAWALAIPLAGEVVGGRRGMWIAGGAWMLGTIIQETWFHPAEGPERRTDLVTRLGPTLIVLAVDLVLHGLNSETGRSDTK